MRGFSCGALFALLSWSCGLYAASGADYLLSQLAGGGDGRPVGLATSYQATAEAVGTLRSLGTPQTLTNSRPFSPPRRITEPSTSPERLLLPSTAGRVQPRC